MAWPPEPTACLCGYSSRIRSSSSAVSAAVHARPAEAVFIGDSVTDNEAGQGRWHTDHRLRQQARQTGTPYRSRSQRRHRHDAAARARVPAGYRQAVRMTDTPAVPAYVLANVRQRWPELADAWASHVQTEFRDLGDQ
jgi:hypothetical protein